MTRDPLILVVNAGSSSLKLTAFIGDRVHLRATVERTNQAVVEPRFWIKDRDEEEVLCGVLPTAEHSTLLQVVLDTVGKRLPGHNVAAIGHRVVHGGNQFTTPVRITQVVLTELESLAPLAPLHQPHNLAEIRAVARLLPDVPQVACFDTAFHSTMPKHERMLGLPRAYFDKGVMRYGFHGLSYESIAGRLPGIDHRAAVGRTVVFHLGSGASLCALLAGKSVATTMSFTPLDGLLMSTRAGAIDAGVVLYLLRNERLTPDQVERLLDRESGLLGVSGISSDLRHLLASSAPEAAEAVDLFCYRVVRETGAMVAALGGLDAIVFTGGIGENSPEIRHRICSQVQWLGAQFNPTANREGRTVLNSDESRVSILRIPADEEAMIARHTVSLVNSSPASSLKWKAL
ncbi:MAG: acetate/propionate family kinase [Planctomycetaceae bacterium]|nr:acetate/propionate family kinase [Planctomycetaceae bacterium]